MSYAYLVEPIDRHWKPGIVHLRSEDRSKKIWWTRAACGYRHTLQVGEAAGVGPGPMPFESFKSKGQKLCARCFPERVAGGQLQLFGGDR